MLTRNGLIQRVHDLLNLIGIIQLVVGQFFIFTIHPRIFWSDLLSAMKMFEKLFDKRFALELIAFQRSNFYYKGTSNNTRFQRFLSWLSGRLQRSFRGESPIGDRFDAWPASARSFARCHTDSTRE